MVDSSWPECLQRVAAHRKHKPGGKDHDQSNHGNRSSKPGKGKEAKRGYAETVADRRLGIATDVYQNPTTSDLRRMVVEQRKRERQGAAASAWKIDESQIVPSVRGFLTNNNVYVWDAYTATHPGMAMASEIISDDDAMYSDDFQSFVAEIGKDGRMTSIAPGDFLKDRKKIDKIAANNPFMNEIWDGEHGDHATVDRASKKSMYGWIFSEQSDSGLPDSVRKSSGCGANGKGGGGFQRGNTCASGGTGGSTLVQNGLFGDEYEAGKFTEAELSELTGIVKPKPPKTIQTVMFDGMNDHPDQGFLFGEDMESQPEVPVKQTDTKEFKSWFGDSKVVDDNGDPMVVYHGTTREFTGFVPKGSATGNGIFFSLEPEFATLYASGKGGRVIPAYISAEQPFDFRNQSDMDSLRSHLKLSDDDLEYWQRNNDAEYYYSVEAGDWDTIESPRFQSFLKDGGHDGYYLMENDYLNIAVFDPSQIKSATGNDGTFDPKNPDITKSLSKARTELADLSGWLAGSLTTQKSVRVRSVFERVMERVDAIESAIEQDCR